MSIALLCPHYRTLLSRGLATVNHNYFQYDELFVMKKLHHIIETDYLFLIKGYCFQNSHLGLI